METTERPRGWGGVSFRGIDVLQYSPDAVDTPICSDPDAISAVARNRVPKMRQGGSYSASSGLSAHFRTSPEVSEKDSAMGLVMYEFSLRSRKYYLLFLDNFFSFCILIIVNFFLFTELKTENN